MRGAHALTAMPSIFHPHSIDNVALYWYFINVYCFTCVHKIEETAIFLLFFI